jgi:hypothetical protein
MIPRVFAFLFARPQSEELAAEHVIREHHLGRVFRDILRDPYLTDRCTQEQIERLLDRPDVIHAVEEDTIAAHRAARAAGASGPNKKGRGGD